MQNTVICKKFLRNFLQITVSFKTLRIIEESGHKPVQALNDTVQGDGPCDLYHLFWALLQTSEVFTLMTLLCPVTLLKVRLFDERSFQKGRTELDYDREPFGSFPRSYSLPLSRAVVKVHAKKLPTQSDSQSVRKETATTILEGFTRSLQVKKKVSVGVVLEPEAEWDSDTQTEHTPGARLVPGASSSGPTLVRTGNGRPTGSRRRGDLGKEEMESPPILLFHSPTYTSWSVPRNLFSARVCEVPYR